MLHRSSIGGDSLPRAALRGGAPLWPLVLTVLALLAVGLGATALYLPGAMQSAAIEAVERSNLEIADQIKITRGYYTQNVVAKAVKSGALTPSFQHKGDPTAIPLPATFVKDISDLLQKRDTTLTLVSPYPWPHRADRRMDDFESAAWEAFQSDAAAVFTRREVRDGKRVLRVAVADVMTSQTCVSCHNTHPQSIKRDWKIGDVRAVMQVTKVIEPYIAAAEHKSRFILLMLGLAALVASAALWTVSALVARRTREKHEANRNIHFLAHHDAMTGLLNLPRFIAELNTALRMRKATRESIAVHYIDLDGFKGINDTLGHGAGDELLRHVAKRLQNAVAGQDLVARVGGDEFIVAQLKATSENDVANFAQRIVKVLSEPFVLDQHHVTVTASVGAVHTSRPARGAEGLVKAADIALYSAKNSGRARYALFSPEMEFEFSARLELEQTVRNASQRGGFELHFQPICNTRTGTLEGFEALLRMRNPAGELIPPSVFIPIAEKSGQIIEIGAWVVGHACTLAATWPKHLTIAVNLSAAQFQQHGECNLQNVVRRALETSGLPPSRLELEITESLLLDSTDLVIAELDGLKELGVSLVMDDFGTGYSSLSYLWKLPLDKLKIDRSFISASTNTPSSVDPILRTIIALGRTLDLRITAEGIESSQQATYCAELGSDQSQGFFFSKPIPEAGLAALLNDAADALGQSFQNRHLAYA